MYDQVFKPEQVEQWCQAVIEALSVLNTSTHDHFDWTIVANSHLSYILISGKKYVALRTLPFKQIIQHCSFWSDIDRFRLTEEEARLLNEINFQHYENFGSLNFTEQDEIILLEDAFEIYEFLKFCDCKARQQSSVREERCGFVRLAPEGKFLPFVRCNSKQYVPLFYMNGEVGYLEELSMEIEGWDLKYLILLCKFHNTASLIPNPRSIRVVNLEIIKIYIPPGATFEEMWPLNGNTLAFLEQFIPSKNHPINIPQRGIISKLPGAQPTTTVGLVNNAFNLEIPSPINPHAKLEMPQYGIVNTNLGQPIVMRALQCPNMNLNIPSNSINTMQQQKPSAGCIPYNIVNTNLGQPNVERDGLAQRQWTQPRTNVPLEYPNMDMNTKSNSINANVIFPIAQPEDSTRCGPPNVGITNLCHSIPNEGRPYNQIVVNQVIPEAQQQSTHPTTTALQCPNITLNSSNAHVMFSTVQQRDTVQPLNILNTNVGRSTQNGDRSYNEIVSQANQAPTVPYLEQNNNTEFLHLPSHINQLLSASLTTANNNMECRIFHIPNFYIEDDSTAYSLTRCKVGSVTLEYSINFAPNDSFALVTLLEVSSEMFDVSCTVLKRVLDFLSFIIFMPNKAQKKLLTSIDLHNGTGLVSVLDLTRYEPKLRELCASYSS